MITPRRRRGPHRGFTLFEVMAAVAVLGIIITVLADASIQGMMIEGDADRRLRASLIADEALHELEGLLRLGQPAPLGTRESGDDEFRVQVTVSPFAPDQLGLEELTNPPEEDGRRPRGRRPASTGSFFEAGPRAAPALVLLQVSVSWQEGVDEVAVTRSSIGFDRVAAAPLLERIASDDAAREQEQPEDERDPRDLDPGDLDPDDEEPT